MYQGKMYQGNENDSSDASTNNEAKLDYFDSFCLKTEMPKATFVGLTSEKE